MKNTLNKLMVVLSALVLFLLCSGCVQENMDELFRLPEPSKEYIELQYKIDEILKSGAVYSAPTSGYHRQSVQLYDINGDGVNEAIAFFSASGDNPLKVYIFQNVDGKYETKTVLEGDGNSIESIYYTDMDADGWSEIILGFKGNELKLLNVYSIKDFQQAVIATSDFTAYTVTDLDMNGRDDLIVVRHNGTEFTGTIEKYSISRDGETVVSGAHLSNGMENIRKLTTGYLSDKSSAVFVEGGFMNGGLITDIFTWVDDRVVNVSADKEGISRELVRSSTMSCRDINGDGVMEIPIPRELPTQSDRVYFVFDWYCYNKWGVKGLALTTYHNNSDFWYLTLPAEWRGSITVRREDTVSGQRTVVFSIWNGENASSTDFLKIYTLTGENRLDRAAMEGRFILRREDEVIYAAELLDIETQWEHYPSKEYIRSNFDLIYSEWVTGQIYT
ncbi:MAG: VCBS repeat-containing protein [Clostridiales bacterium]|jgi:hypothetical protein|nr:VCBS repeat-containing protein [Clostridiales bacterium]